MSKLLTRTFTVSAKKKRTGFWNTALPSLTRKDIHIPLFMFYLVLGTAALTYGMSRFILWERGNMVYPLLWLSGFAVLSFDLVLNVTCALLFSFTRPLILKEKDLKALPPVAIVYPIRNEGTGLYERMSYTIEKNNLPTMTFCFLSDSSPEFFAYESSVVKQLRARFGNDKIYYRHRVKPVNAKPGNIGEWLTEHQADFKYFFVCDADSLVPSGALLKMLRKAEHPDNVSVAILQTRIEVAHAKTFFSMYQSVGVRLSQLLYADVKQRVLGSALSFGHGNLIRTAAFTKIAVPSGVLSHDIWDMALLSRLGYRTVFCPDVVSYEEVPNNYIEMRDRDRRWIKGNMQTFPLLFTPGLTLSARFYIFYGIFMYLCQPVFLAWIIFSVFGNTELFGQHIYFMPIISAGPHPFYFEVYYFTVAIFAALFLHKFLICRRWSDIFAVTEEIVCSTLISLNNIVYQSFDLAVLLFQRITWVPMKKDPYKTLTFFRTVRTLWPGTALGVFLGYVVLTYCPPVTFIVMPVLVCFSISIPIVYLTSLPWLR